MRVSSLVAALSVGAATVDAFPHMVSSLFPFLFKCTDTSKLRDMGMNNVAQFEKLVRREGPQALRRSPVEKRQTQLPISIPLPALPIPGLNIPTSIDLPFIVSVGTEVIPDAAHPFQPPVAGDQRGGCPGLNIMSAFKSLYFILLELMLISTSR